MDLFGSYQRDQYADPQSFAVQALMVFERYEVAIVEYLTDPRNSDALQHRHPKFPPTVGEIRAACEDRAATVARLRQPAQKMIARPYVPPERWPGCRANVFIGQDMPSYSEIEQLVQSGELDPLDWRFDQGRNGIWITLPIWESRRQIIRQSTAWKPLSDDELRAHYGRREADLAKARQNEVPQETTP